MQEYLKIFRAFLDDEITAREAEEKFLQAWKAERDKSLASFKGDIKTLAPATEQQKIVDKVFTDFDVFSENPRSEDFEIDEAELRRCVEKAYRQLLKISNQA